MGENVTRIRTLLGSEDPALHVQARELLAMLGEGALYAEILSGWRWNDDPQRVDTKLRWIGESDAPFPRELATKLWLDAPLGAPFPPRLGLASVRDLDVDWPEPFLAREKLSALTGVTRAFVSSSAGDSPPFPLASLPAGVRHLVLESVQSPQLEGLAAMSNLRHLLLYHSELESEAIPALPHLTGLSVADCSGDAGFGAQRVWGSLRYLRILESQHIQSLPALPSLRYLSLFRVDEGVLVGLSARRGLLALALSSDLDAVPPSIFELSQLQSLDLRDNQLERLPPEIGRLSRLRRLNLEENPLVELPPEMASLRNLRALDLSFCAELKRLPPWLPALERLEMLGLCWIQLAELPADLLLALPRLRCLRVDSLLFDQAQALAERAWEEQGRRIEVDATR